jgi:hypothetical protein
LNARIIQVVHGFAVMQLTTRGRGFRENSRDLLLAKPLRILRIARGTGREIRPVIPHRCVSRRRRVQELADAVRRGQWLSAEVEAAEKKALEELASWRQAVLDAVRAIGARH